MKIAVLGANGLLGSSLYQFFSDNSDDDVYGITRDNYSKYINQDFDVFINANGNSKRFWANNNIIEDFEASTVSVYKTFFNFVTSLYVYISSVDVYSNHEDIQETRECKKINIPNLCSYGFHKYLSEIIVKKYAKSYLILRCSALVGENLIKGPIRDILDDKPLFLSPDSQLQFISTTEIAKVIEVLIDNNVENEIFNVGGLGTVSILDLKDLLHKNISFHSNNRREVYEMDVLKLKKLFPLVKSEHYVKKLIYHE